MSNSGVGSMSSISEVVERYGVTARALRFYETKGLLSPVRKGRSRVYAPDDLSRLDFILRARRLGFSLDEIKDMLDQPYSAKSSGDVGVVRATRLRMGERAAALQILKDDIEVLLRELTARNTALDQALAAAGASLDEDDDLRTRAAAFQRLGKSWVWSDASA